MNNEDKAFFWGLATGVVCALIPITLVALFGV